MDAGSKDGMGQKDRDERGWIRFEKIVSQDARLERERERKIQSYVHSASVAYEDKSLFMSQPIERWLSGNQKHPPGPCAT